MASIRYNKLYAKGIHGSLRNFLPQSAYPAPGLEDILPRWPGYSSELFAWVPVTPSASLLPTGAWHLSPCTYPKTASPVSSNLP